MVKVDGRRRLVWLKCQEGLLEANLAGEISGGNKATATSGIRPFRLRTLVLCLPVFLLLAAAAPRASHADESDRTVRLAEHLTLGLKVDRYIGSHTSYEFGNPFPPYQVPLSRLEFPLDSWWGGAELRASFPRFSAGVEILTNLSRDADGKMMDSDWDDDSRPGVKTIYSESECSINPSYIFVADLDLRVSDWLDLPDWFDPRPLVGFRRQDFNFMAHDGMQWDLTGGSNPLPLPGDSLRFQQTYTQVFLGLRAACDLGTFARVRRLTARLQCDWAYVEGHNEDHHLLRVGRRYTYEDTYGDAWHGSFGIEAELLERLTLAFEGDFLAISTTGVHRLVNTLFDIDFSFTNGVRAWSEQNRLSLMLRYAF